MTDFTIFFTILVKWDPFSKDCLTKMGPSSRVDREIPEWEILGGKYRLGNKRPSGKYWEIWENF